MSAPVKTVSGANLEAFEKAVYSRTKENRIAENDAATRVLRECLSSFREGAGFAGHPQISTALMTRMASAMTALFLDPYGRRADPNIDLRQLKGGGARSPA